MSFLLKIPSPLVVSIMHNQHMRLHDLCDYLHLKRTDCFLLKLPKFILPGALVDWANSSSESSSS